MRIPKSSILLIALVVLFFLPACSKEPSLIEEAMLQKDQQKALDTAKANQTKEEPKEIVPADFLESCEFNFALESYEYRENGKVCIDKDDQLIMYLKNVGFDPINSIRLIVGAEEILSEENDLDPDKMRIYRFDEVALNGIDSIKVVPRGKFYDNKIYDCDKSRITLSTSNIDKCIIN